MIPAPFLPLEVTREGLSFTVSFLAGAITFNEYLLPVSIRAGQTELLARPVELRTVEDGEPGPFVPDETWLGESEPFIQSREDDRVVLCGCMQSRRFVIDLAATVTYDGSLSYSMKVMPRGLTVAQSFGLDGVKELRYLLDALHLEIPMRRACAGLYQFYPRSPVHLENGEDIVRFAHAGAVPQVNAAVPFKATLWLGNDDCGLGFFAESDEHWQPTDRERVIEWLPGESELLMRVHILDSNPVGWSGKPEGWLNNYNVLTFAFGFQVTPVKPLPKEPLMHGLHIDCFRKTKGNYIDWLLEEHPAGCGENGFDRMAQLGVDTLILHEKWNKSQNFVELSEYTAEQLRRIVSECHRRGIRVLTYFGYEYSSMAHDFAEVGGRYCTKTASGALTGGWYRVPYQRDYIVCSNSDYADRWVDGIVRIMDTFHIDGVYLDGTAVPRPCANAAHGCGYDGPDGRHETYPIHSRRRMFERLYREVHARGGLINVHTNALNFTVLPFIDLLWCGEDLQHDYTRGNFSDLNLDFFRALYTGRNTGVPVEMIAYENRPVWNFENALATSIIHGILPRPNDIEWPLEYMSRFWKIWKQFPVAQSEWVPYYAAGAATASDDGVKVSFYRHEAPDGEVMELVFCANISKHDASGVRITLPRDVSRVVELPERTACAACGDGFVTDLAAYTCRVFLVR